MPELGDGPIQPEFLKLMNDLARYLDFKFNGTATGDAKKNGFILLLFPFGGDGRCNYISNANREDVVIMLKEQIKRFEGQPEVKGTA